MIRLLGTLPAAPVWVACSGGVDSVVAAFFLQRARPVRLAFFDHGTESSQQALKFLQTAEQFKGFELTVGTITGSRAPGDSWEEHWRHERYNFLSTLPGTVITAHHLDDAVETYVWRMCHGRSDTIPYRRGSVIRPFLLTPKSVLVDYARRHDLHWIEDASNQDTAYTRNHVRHRVIPELLKVNPGLATTVAKLVKKAYNQTHKQENCK